MGGKAGDAVIRKKLRLNPTTIRVLTAPQLSAGVPRGLCTDTCDVCPSLYMTCQGNTCGTPVAQG